MEKSFLEYYDFYEGVCKERLHLQGQNMQVMTVCKCALLYFTSRLIICHFGCCHNIRSITLCKHWAVETLQTFLFAAVSHSRQRLQKTSGNTESDVLPHLPVKSWAESLRTASIRQQPFLWDFWVVIVLKSHYESLFRHFVVVAHIVMWSCCSDGDWILLSLCDLFLLFL